MLIDIEVPGTGMVTKPGSGYLPIEVTCWFESEELEKRGT